MNINKVDNQGDSRFKKTDATSKGEKSAGSSAKSSSANNATDKVSLSDYKFRNNDQLFAKLEMEKLNESSSGRLQELKAQISEFQKAEDASEAENTDIGQKINDPDVWEGIARKILQ